MKEEYSMAASMMAMTARATRGILTAKAHVYQKSSTKVQQTTGFAVFFPEKKKKKEDTFCAPVRKKPCDVGKRQGYGNAGGMNVSIARTVHRTWHVMCDVIKWCLSLFSRRQLRDFTSDRKKSKREEQQGESRQQKESFQLEIDAEDPAQTRESKKSENQEKRRAAIEQRHLERTEA
jgi:hypothetical protein